METKETMTDEQVSDMQLASPSQNKEADQQAAAALLEELSERLFEYAMKDQWEEVAEAYRHKPECRKAKITEAEDTALHLAVSGGKLEFVYELVDQILGEDGADVLRAKNKRGNTALHTAAALGNAQMCHCLAAKDPNLIAETNNKNETPFYLAAHFGQKDAFLCLYFCSQGSRGASDICSRDDSGNTILHAAIAGEHFDLAFKIICKYPDLVNAVNVNGMSPLHVLATKANAFKSGSCLGLLDRILYRCVIVDEMKDIEDESKEDFFKRLQENGNGRQPRFPQNYQTCVHFFRMLVGVTCYGMPSFVEICSFLGSQFLSFINPKNKKSNSITDEENPPGTNKATPGESSASSNANGAAKESLDKGSGNSPKEKEERKYQEKSSPKQHREDYLPANYATIIQFFKFVIKFVMVVLGHGFEGIKRITIKKQRHTWATEVMNKLIENTSMYKYSSGQTGRGHGGFTDIDDFPHNLTLMTTASPSHPQDHTNTVNVSSLESLDKLLGDDQSLGQSQKKTESLRKDGSGAMVEKFLGEYHITGTVVSKTSKQAVQMKFEKKVAIEPTKPKSPILIAASKGITEMVEKILEKFPVAIQDVDAENKNVLLLAVENRQTHTFQFLTGKMFLPGTVFRQWDNQGNNALHLAASYGHYRPWLIPGSALQMQWELKWYKFVKKSMEKHLQLVHYNKNGQTPKQIFTETHKALVKDGSEWLTKTSESCSLIAALIATVAFATAANIPGGVEEKTGEPVLRNEPAFSVFAISSLVALSFSLTALVFFLAIITSRFEERDFAMKLPRKLILGLTALFTSITAMLVSFCAGHFFELRDKLKLAALPIYTATCLPISLFALAQLPLYLDLLWAIYKKVPQRSYKETAAS